MFKNLKIGMKLGIGFALVLAALIVISSVSIMRLSDLSSSTKVIVDECMPMLAMVN